MPANINHFAYTKGETTIVLFGQGPVEITYVNRADDPRTAPARSGKRIESGSTIEDAGQRSADEEHGL